MKTFEHGGRTFVMRIERDETMGEPWKVHDGHGVVTEWTETAPDEAARILVSDRYSHRFYDVTASLKRAQAERWDAPPYGQGNSHEQAARAVEADYQRMRAWCNDEWYWVGVVVHLQCPTCGSEHPGKQDSHWGIESDSDADYFDTVARELAEEIPL
jgi:hypothetical protein